MAEQMRFVCKYCGSGVEHRPRFGADSPRRWVHVPSLDCRCLLFAEPFALLGRGVAQETQQR